MAWIESHQTLGAHMKLRRFARALDISRPTAVGHLHYLWWWALDGAPTGDLSAYTAAEIAEVAEWTDDAEQFVAALRDCRWLNPDGHIHDWNEYAGKLTQRRATNKKRMQQARIESVQDTCNARATHMQDTCNAHAAHVQTRVGLQYSTVQDSTVQDRTTRESAVLKISARVEPEVASLPSLDFASLQGKVAPLPGTVTEDSNGGGLHGAPAHPEPPNHIFVPPELSDAPTGVLDRNEPGRFLTKAEILAGDPVAGRPPWLDLVTAADRLGRDEKYALSFFEYHEAKNLWLNKYERPIHWKSELARWSKKDRAWVEEEIEKKRMKARNLNNNL